MRIVRIANFVTPVSGGVRTALSHLSREYRTRGIDPVLVIPGPSDAREDGPDGAIITIASPRLPGSSYHVLIDRRRLQRELRQLAPDAVEVHDRFTLPWVATWLRRHRVPVLLMVHERLRTPLRAFAHVPDAAADIAEVSANRRLVEEVGPVVVASRSVARTFPEGGAVVVPLGVDRSLFPPRSMRGDDGALRLTIVGRLSPEKGPLLAVDTATMLCGRGHDVHLDVVGTGPLARRVARRAPWGRATLHGHLPQHEVARIVRGADVMLAPCSTEAFGLAALEALASGVPVVAHRDGAVVEMLGLPGEDPALRVPAPGSDYAPHRRPPHVGAAGAVADGYARDFAGAVESLLTVPEPRRREAAIGRAALHTWRATADGLLAMLRVDSAVTPTSAPDAVVIDIRTRAAARPASDALTAVTPARSVP
jgi:alpha-1,6-mannosyltransferase